MKALPGVVPPKVRRRWIVLAIVVAVLFTSYRLLDSRTYIYYYRVVDDHTLAVGTVSGPGAWARVSSVTETPTTVSVIVSNFYFQLGASTGVGIEYESVAKLQDPLGTRTVIDGSDGHSVERVACPPPSFSAPGCP
jgi:hypothetical protein